MRFGMRIMAWLGMAMLAGCVTLPWRERPVTDAQQDEATNAVPVVVIDAQPEATVASVVEVPVVVPSVEDDEDDDDDDYAGNPAAMVPARPGEGYRERLLRVRAELSEPVPDDDGDDEDEE